MDDAVSIPNPRGLAGLAIGSVWVFHGLYSKLLRGIPRHERIVARVLGERWAKPATKLVGAGEVLLGLWVFAGWQPLPCAAIQTVALVAMNTLEIIRARDLLISPAGMVALNAVSRADLVVGVHRKLIQPAGLPGAARGE